MPSDRFKRYRHTDRGRYTRHKANAKRRGVAFLFTFDDWLACWKASGYWLMPGYVMCRYADTGAYAKGNVYIGTKASNARDRNFKYGHPSQYCSEDDVQPYSVMCSTQVPMGTTDT